MNNKEFPAKIANLYLSADAANHELADTILLGQCANYNDKQKRELAYQICEFYYKSPEFLQFVKDAPIIAKDAAISWFQKKKYLLPQPVNLVHFFYDKKPCLKIRLTLEVSKFNSFALSRPNPSDLELILHNFILSSYDSGNYSLKANLDSGISNAGNSVKFCDNLDSFMQQIIDKKTAEFFKTQF